jgi:CRISPR-associated endonuclease/helicase Cas3
MQKCSIQKVIRGKSVQKDGYASLKKNDAYPFVLQLREQKEENILRVLILVFDMNHEFLHSSENLCNSAIFPLIWRNQCIILPLSQQEGDSKMITDGSKKSDRLLQIIKLFQKPGQRLRTRQIADALRVDGDTVNKYLKELSLSGRLPLTKEGHCWVLPEGAVVPELAVSLSYAEAVGFYLAGRLLAQTQDEENWHLTMALQKLVEALPDSLKEQQKTLLKLLIFQENEQEEQQRDLSHIFQILASGWMMRRRVRLHYVPPHKSGFDCCFDPYLLEPSAIGRTIYALGLSSTVNDLRTYKLERIQKAELTDEVFSLRPDFDGPKLLQQAWGVMYGDEQPMHVRLRFSAGVTPRVRETKWHPSQQLKLTRDGCEWTALIGDILEIEPWIRSWGADCEVLEPEVLRTRIRGHLHRASQMYQLEKPLAHDPTKLNRDLFKKE